MEIILLVVVVIIDFAFFLIIELNTKNSHSGNISGTENIYSDVFIVEKVAYLNTTDSNFSHYPIYEVFENKDSSYSRLYETRNKEDAESFRLKRIQQIIDFTNRK